MPSKKSDNLRVEAQLTGWRDALWANLPVPVVLGAMVLLGFAVESRAFGGYNQRIVMLIGFNIILAVSLQLINGFSGQFSLGHAGFMAVGAYMAAYPAITFSNGFDDPAAPLWFYVCLAIVVGLIGALLWFVFLGIRATQRIHPGCAPLAIILALLVWILVDLANSGDGRLPAWSIWPRIFSAVPAMFSWLLSHGAPIASKISLWLPEFARGPICFIILVVGGGSCAAVVGFIVGLPALRLRGDYLAIATLGMAEIIRILIQVSQPLGAALGLTNIPKGTNFAWLYGFVIITIVVVWRVAYSAKGRSIMAVREDEIAASATGIDTTHHKVVAFMIGSFFGGVAGALFALHERSIAPYQFGLLKSIEAVVIVTLGGLGSISGAILAAIVLTLLPEVLRPIAEYRMIIYSLMLILMMLLRPQGLIGGIELWPKRKRESNMLPTAEAGTS